MRPSAASAAGLALALLLSLPASAHTTIDFASPGPGMRVTGNLARIELGFADPVFDPVVTLTAPDGEVVEGRVEFIDDRTIAFVTGGLEDKGEYIVRYRVTAPDDDDRPEFEGAYAFTFLGGGGSSAGNWPYFAGVALVLTSIGVFAVRRAFRIPPRDETSTSG